MTRRDLDQVIFALASLISENVPQRIMRHKGRAAEVHLDVTEALRTFVDAVREQAKRDATQIASDMISRSIDRVARPSSFVAYQSDYGLELRRVATNGLRECRANGCKTFLLLPYDGHYCEEHRP